MPHVATFLAVSERLILPGIGMVLGAFLFAVGYRLLRRKRLILNTPASKIRSAAMGLVEVSGSTTGPFFITSPLKKAPCYFHRSVVWQWEEGKDGGWNKVAEEILHVPFYVDDSTDKVLVDARGAEIDLHCDFDEQYERGAAESPQIPGAVHDFLLRNRIDPEKKLRVEEFCIKPKDFVFVLGTLSQNPGIDASITPVYAERVNKRLSPPPKKAAASEPPQEIIRLSGEATALPVTKMTQQQKIAAALMRAGMHNPAAWNSPSPETSAANPPKSLGAGAADEQTQKGNPASGSSFTRNAEPRGDVGGEASPERKVPPISVTRTKEASPSPDTAKPVLEESEATEHETFDLHPPVVLMKGTKEPAFFISWRSQRDVVQSFVWKSRLMFWGAPVLMLASFYFLWIGLHHR